MMTLANIPIILEKVDKEDLNKQILRTAMLAELDAINLYEQMAALTDDKNIKAVHGKRADVRQTTRLDRELGRAHAVVGAALEPEIERRQGTRGGAGVLEGIGRARADGPAVAILRGGRPAGAEPRDDREDTQKEAFHVSAPRGSGGHSEDAFRPPPP